jgi:hypothetical protein
MLKPLKLLANAFPTLRIAPHPEMDNARMIIVNILFSSFLNISPPRLQPIIIIRDSVWKRSIELIEIKRG